MVKVDRKKLLNEPDEFQTFTDLAVKWGQENKRLIVVIAIVLVLAVGGTVGIRSYLGSSGRNRVQRHVFGLFGL